MLGAPHVMIVELAAGDHRNVHRPEIGATDDPHLRIGHPREILLERLPVDAEVAIGRAALDGQHMDVSRGEHAGDVASALEQWRVESGVTFAVSTGRNWRG